MMMPMEMKLWRVGDGDLRELDLTEPDSEWDLEDWIAEDSTILADDLLIIGRQVPSDLGGVLDLLAIDAEGGVVIVELKRNLTPREVVAQVLHYAAWVRTLTWDQIAEITEDYLDQPLETAFHDHFEADLPEEPRPDHRMLIVAAALDDQSEAIVQYLSEHWSVDINAVFFRCFREEDGRSYLGRTWLMEPSAVEVRAASRGRRPKRTLAELQELADDSGQGDLYRHAFERFESITQRVPRRRKSVAFQVRRPEGMRSVVSLYPGKTSKGPGLYADIRVSWLAELLDVHEDAVRQHLPVRADVTEADRVFGEAFLFQSEDEIDRLTALADE